MNDQPLQNKKNLLFKTFLKHFSIGLEDLTIKKRLSILSVIHVRSGIILSFQEFQILYQRKTQELLGRFPKDKDPQKTYETIISLGKTLPTPSFSIQKEENIVEGCQSVVYLQAESGEDGKIWYHVQSDALISSGLAVLLLTLYQGEKAEFLLVCPPLFLQELGLQQSLSPGRSNGLASMYARMKKEALRLLKNPTK